MLHNKRPKGTRCVCFFVLTAIIGASQYIFRRVDTWAWYNRICSDDILERERSIIFCGQKQIGTTGKEDTQSGRSIIRPAFVKSSQSGLYLFSALKFSNSTETESNRIIVITGWYVRAKNNVITYRCCVLEADGKIHSRKAEKRKTHFESKLIRFNGLQCVCQLQSTPGSVTRASLVAGKDSCMRNISHFIEVETVSRQRVDGIVICAKVQYGEIDAGYLIEWFEAQRFLGINRILCYVHKDLNVDSVNVLRYYEKIGLATIFPFDVPENDTYPRHLWEKNKIAWTDQGIAALDCYERMKAYKYGIFLDTDEILLPENMALKDSLKRYFELKFLSSPNLAIMRFNTMMHITSWGPTIPNHRLFVGRQVNSTLAMFDRSKYAFRPERVIPGSCFSHFCRIKYGYKSEHVKDLSAVIHHFRSCRTEWNREATDSLLKQKDILINETTRNVCYNFKRHGSDVVKTLADEIEKSVFKVRSFLYL